MCSLGAIEGLQRPVQCRDKTVAEQVHSPTQQGQRGLCGSNRVLSDRQTASETPRSHNRADNFSNFLKLTIMPTA